MITRRTRNLVLTALIPIIGLTLLGQLWRGGSTTERLPEQTSTVTPEPAQPEMGASPAGTRGTRLYSIAMFRLQGLSPETPPGTEVEVWVSWKPKNPGTPQMQLLVERASVESIEPPMSDGSPPIVTFRIDKRSVSDMIWGEMFGSLAVARIEG